MKRLRHTIAQIPIAEGGIGTSLPFLFLDSGELSLLALAWARAKVLDEGAGPAAVAKSIAGIGWFYDYYMVVCDGKTLLEDELHLELRKFFEARRYGSKLLGWTSVKEDTAASDVRAVSAFTEWCSNNFGHAVFNPLERTLVANLNLPDQIRFFSGRAGRKRWDFLYHLTPQAADKDEVSRRRFTPRIKKQTYTGVKKYFPPEKVWSVIAAATSTRDRLYLLLLFFGGLRMSEPLHLFTSDITIRPDGTARVVLGNPQDGAYEWTEFGKRKKGNRISYLSQRYGIGPRHLLSVNHPLRAGWKGMLIESQERNESEVHWLDERASRLFAILHAQYVRSTRGLITDEHPFYFVNEKDDEFSGQPLKVSNAAKVFSRAAARVGLRPTEDGVKPHGARHFYGYYCASILKIPIETTQKLMHHVSPLSTEVYYALSGEAIREQLIRAQTRVEAHGDGLLLAYHPSLKIGNIENV